MYRSSRPHSGLGRAETEGPGTFRTCRLGWVALWLTLAALPAGAVSPIHQFELANGMKVLVRPDERAPVVVSQVWYRVGSVDEYRGVTGISHVLEHMMFKGTDDYAPGEMSQIIARHGGEENAFTSRDYTAYYQQVGRDHLERMLELEAERMGDLTVPAEAFRKEIQVVQEERRRRVEDQPRALVGERLRAAAFPASTARSPVIGWRADLEHMGVAEVRSWYDDWYGPNNAALVVVGDVEPAAVRSMAQTYFGDKRAVELPRRRPTAELEPRGPQRLEVRVKAELPHIALAWRVPSLSTVGDRADAYALDVLAGILDGGRSARIPRRIVRGQALAANASASYTLVSRSDTLLTISATPAGERSVAELESALLDQVEVLKSGRVEASELERVKTNVRASDVFSRDSMFYQALRIGRLEMTGLGQDAYEDYLAGVADVTPADVQRVAQRYLVAERRTVAELVPQAIQSAQGEAGSTNGGQVGSEVSP